MRLRFALILGLVVLGGCDLAVPNGLFGCGQPTDCPSGYFCWNSDSRCYDSNEPACVPKTCDQVIGDFASLGIPIECGSLPDGCEGSIECGGCAEGSVCGANGQNFICGCEENTCANFAGGVECGVIPTRCGGQQDSDLLRQLLGRVLVCLDNECVCPPGVNCDTGCGDRCVGQEVCVDGQCCEPTYPCADNECSPPGGLPDGCGGVAQCPPCGNGEDCVLSERPPSMSASAIAPARRKESNAATRRSAGRPRFAAPAPTTGSKAATIARAGAASAKTRSSSTTRSPARRWSAEREPPQLHAGCLGCRRPGHAPQLEGHRLLRCKCSTLVRRSSPRPTAGRAPSPLHGLSLPGRSRRHRQLLGVDRLRRRHQVLRRRGRHHRHRARVRRQRQLGNRDRFWSASRPRSSGLTATATDSTSTRPTRSDSQTLTPRSPHTSNSTNGS